MDDDWKEWDVLTTLRPLHPPRFMLEGVDGETWAERSGTVLKDHWRHEVGILNTEGGYERLLAMKERLEAHRKQLEVPLKREKDRIKYLKLLAVKYANKPRELLDGADAEAIDEAMDRPMGELLLEFNDEGDPVEGHPSMDGWWSEASREVGEVVELGLENFNVCYEPPGGELKKQGIERDLLRPSEAPFLDASQTWREAVQTLFQRMEEPETLHQQLNRTDDLLKFRLAVVDTVLYQREVFMDVMSPEEVAPFARENTVNERVHRHVIELAEVLMQHIKKHGALPSFDQKTGEGGMNGWLAQKSDAIVAGSAVRGWLNKTGLYVTGQHGKTEGIEETLLNIIEYGERHDVSL